MTLFSMAKSAVSVRILQYSVRQSENDESSKLTMKVTPLLLSKRDRVAEWNGISVDFQLPSLPDSRIINVKAVGHPNRAHASPSWRGAAFIDIICQVSRSLRIRCAKIVPPHRPLAPPRRPRYARRQSHHRSFFCSFSVKCSLALVRPHQSSRG